MVIPDEALEWAKPSGIDLPPKNYDAIQSPSLNTKSHNNPKVFMNLLTVSSMFEGLFLVES